jgi:ribosomal protein S18 acetylase RimI-like enzyme
MIDIRSAATVHDFEIACDLISAMADWDIRETRERGLSVADLISDAYSHTPATLKAKFDQPKAGLFIARVGGKAAGCLAFAKLDDGSGEVQKLFVDPGCRGNGVARSLMTATLEEMDRVGYRLARLETVLFMTDAIALYRSVGFVPCKPFRSPVVGLETITIFMESPLSGRILTA